MGRSGKFSKQNHLRSPIIKGTDLSRFKRPPEKDWDPTETFTFPIFQNSRTHVRANYYRGKVIDFCITHQVGGPYEWQELCGIDCSHDTVHVHDFTSGKENRMEIEDITDSDVVHRHYAEQYEYILNSAEDEKGCGAMNQDELVDRRNRVSASLLASITELNITSRLKVTGIDGSKPIVIALGEETIGDVFTRISWSGGFANLFIVSNSESGRNTVSLASIMPPASSLHEREAEPIQLFNADSPIAMLAELAGQRDGLASFNISFSGATAKVESIEEATDLVSA